MGLLVAAAVFTLLVATMASALDGREADLVLGDVVGARGQTVGVDVVANTQGGVAKAIQVNFAFDGAVLVNPVGLAGSNPLPGSLVCNSPAPGSLNCLALDLAGVGIPLEGDVMRVEFDVAGDAPFGPHVVSTSLVDIQGENDILPVTVVNGLVTVVDLFLNSVIIIGLPPELTDPHVEPRHVKGAIGTVVQLTGLALEDGVEVDITANVTWLSGGATVVAVTPSGEVTIVGSGNASVSGIFTPS
jgi:hypothetical protein